MDETKIPSNDENEKNTNYKTKVNTEDKTKVAPTEELKETPINEKEITQSEEMDGLRTEERTDNQTTLKGADYYAITNQETAVNQGKTSSAFSISDINQKLESEIANIPEDYTEDFGTDHMSQLIKSYFPDRTHKEIIRINRNFLKDAEPFNIEKLIEDIKKTPEGLLTGFKSIDQLITIPSDAVSIIASHPKHGKTCFMLNMLLNMCIQYEDKRFLFYIYEEPKREILTKLINICGTKQFTQRECITSNLDCWKYELKNNDIETLKEKANKDIEYIGLKKFLEISARIQVIDSGHNINDLIDSIQSFNSAFDVGAVFIDSLQKIGPDNNKSTMARKQQLQEISDKLRKLANEIRFPLIVSTQLTSGPKGSPEYDDLCEDNLREVGNPEQNAGLIIGLQNYSRSKFIGSNLNTNFSSKFYGQALKKAKPMSENIKDMMKKTILLAKVIANKTGPEPEVELIFHKQLLKISDFQDDALNV